MENAPTLEEILNEVAALIEEPQPDPDEFSASQYAAHQGITYDAAAGLLERAYRAGKLTRRKLGKGWYYRKA